MNLGTDIGLGSAARYIFRDRAPRSRQVLRSTASASPVLDDSSSLHVSDESYGHELQGGLGVRLTDLALVLYTNRPAAAPPEGHVAEFHNVLPQEIRLLSSGEI